MAKERVELLRTVCSQRGEDVSGFVRRAVLRELAALSYLSEAEKKALGVRVSARHVEPDTQEVLCTECRAAFAERRDRPSTASSGKAASY